MESENLCRNGELKRKKETQQDVITNNNSSSKCYSKSSLWKDMYEVGVIGMIDVDEGMGASQPNSPSPPKSPPPDSLLSSPDKFESPESLVYQARKKQKHHERFLTGSSPMEENDGIDKEDMFDWLSDEIILYIFSLVPKNMLATLSLVCKRFRDLCLDESFWPRFDLSFKTLAPHTLGYVLMRGVRALRLNSSAISAPIFNPAHPLRDSYTFKIEYLDLSDVHISIKDLEQLLSRCKNLKKLSVEACEVSDGVCRAIAQNSKIDTLNMAMCSGISDQGLHMIVTSCEIENINISWCGLSPEAVSDFCRNVSSSLLTLNLAGSLRSLSDDDIEYLTARCPELTELDISDCIKITGEAINYLVKDAHNLQSLSISRSYKINGAAVLRLKGKPSLCTLNMFGNSNGFMFSAEHMKFLKCSLPGVAINSEMMSSIARPTVGIRRTSIWGIRCRE